MRWPVAHDAEVLRRAHQAGAKYRLPQPVDVDTGGQRVIRVNQPTGQMQPVVGRFFVGRSKIGIGNS